MALKKLFVPHLNRKMKMGRRHPVALGPRLHLKKYLRLPLLHVPAQFDSQPALTVLDQVLLNDKLGTSVIATAYHALAVGASKAGKLVEVTDQQVIEDYRAIGGYVFGKSGTDKGCDELTAFNYWSECGFANGMKLLGWLAVDPLNVEEVVAAQYVFENVFLAVDLPEGWVDPMPRSTGFTWNEDGPPDSENGHCMFGVGYDAKGLIVDTWGLRGTMTWKAIANYCLRANGGGLYVVLTPEEARRGQNKAPDGIDWTALMQDFDAMKGKVAPPSPLPSTQLRPILKPLEPRESKPTVLGSEIATIPVAGKGDVAKAAAHVAGDREMPAASANVRPELMSRREIMVQTEKVSGAAGAPRVFAPRLAGKGYLPAANELPRPGHGQPPIPKPKPAPKPGPKPKPAPSPGFGITSGIVAPFGKFVWGPVPSYSVPPVPLPRSPLTAAEPAVVRALVSSPALGTVAVVGLVVVGVVGVVALSSGTG